MTIATCLILTAGFLIGGAATGQDAAKADSPSIHFPMGRMYHGPNGLEIRLNRRASEIAYLGSSVYGGAAIGGTKAGQAALTKFGPMMQSIFRSGVKMPKLDSQHSWLLVAGVTEQALQWVLLPDGQCIAITIGPLMSIYTYMTGYGGISSIWLEPCS